MTDAAAPTESRELHVALIGNPNTGKSTLFGRLCGVRTSTANFPGTTQDARRGVAVLPSGPVSLVDLPGAYSLELDQAEAAVCRGVLAGDIAPRGEDPRAPDTICVVVDATNLARNLMIVGEALRRRLPTVVAVNMIDLARRRGVHIDIQRLSESLGCDVVACCARSGEGVDCLTEAIGRARTSNRTPPGSLDELEAWADEVYASAAAGDESLDDDTITDRLDRAFTHPLLGLGVFVAIMGGLFWVVFKLAAYPMEWIDLLFAWFGGAVATTLPEGLIANLLTDGVIAGVGATVIFLPQIALLIFLITVLEDTGYLARAAFVTDRLLRPFGLSGHSFVPLLSSHACALPGIMSARAVPDRRDRLATILSAPFMSCTARIPVYVLLTSLLFADSAALAAAAFLGCYVLGALAGVLSALIARRTILRGKSRPMAIELPSYKRPNLWTAILVTRDRCWVFLKKAGTVILMISIVLWWLGSYPVADTPAEATQLREAAANVAAPDESEALLAEADSIESIHVAKNTFIGRLGGFMSPIFEPLGYDRQLTVGVLASFAAREVFVTTMAVQVIGDDEMEEEGLFRALATAKRDDGATPIFTEATSWSLLVYYVLAMQCLPTLAVTAREAGGWRWAMLQLGWMTAVAYISALIVFQIVSGLGG